MPTAKKTTKTAKKKTTKIPSTGAKNLVIVESPTKAKTLAKILDKNYEITSSYGHIRDLPKSGLGIDVEHNFTPEYVIPEKATKRVKDLKKYLKDSEHVFLATDPDREGEAIAWHLHHILTSAKDGKKKTYERVTFHELTKDAVLEAFSHPSQLNDNLVDSQQARRILDRLVGYKLSPLLWKKVRFGLSAGRVQSVAVRLIIERERERNAFNPEEYWSIEANLSSATDKVARNLTVLLDKKDGKKIAITNEKDAQKVESDLNADTFAISAIEKSERSKKPYAPFKTSTLQQAMANTFGMSASKTMSAAQKLFEQGLITYHRTDSLSMSPQFVDSVRAYIKKEYGAKYLPDNAVFYKTNAKNAQEAHEAIRPTDVKMAPSATKVTQLGREAQVVYELIWRRSLECQMVSAVYDQTSIKVTTDKEKYELKASGSVVKFDGWLAVGAKLGHESVDSIISLPEFVAHEKMDLLQVISNQHFTQPPARYSDASLIKTLEELEIGRPSTYAPTIQTIQNRGYVEKDNRYFVPKDVAYVVIDLLVEHFPEIVGYEFTAKMENDLDAIAAGEKEWVPIIRDFYTPFEKTLAAKEDELSKKDVTTLEVLEEKCPECGKPLVIKLGKYGKFISCSDYPECKYARPTEDMETDEDFGKCEVCGAGDMTLKQGRFGKFLACSNYPKCKTAKPYLDKIGMKCPKCETGEVVVKKAKRREFFGCSNYPDCDYASWKNPLEKKEDANI